MNIIRKILDKPLLLFTVTSAVMFWLEIENASCDCFIDQNVFFILQILKVIFLVQATKNLKEYCKKHDFVEISLLYYANVVLGVLAIVCGIDWFASSISTILSFYGPATYYIWVLGVETILFFIAGLLFLIHMKGFMKILHCPFFYLFFFVSFIYFCSEISSKHIGTDSSTFEYFLAATILFYAYHLVLSFVIEKEFFRKEEN